MNKLFAHISLEGETQPLAEGAGEQAIEDQEIAGEVEAVNAEMQELEQAISTSEQAAEALEQVQEFVESKQAEGGLNEQAAEAVQVATEAMVSCFGGHVTIKHPALESFGKEGGRATATAYTLENLGDTIKKIWEAIKKWVKDFIAKAKDWFRAHFSAAGMLKKAGEALAEKARAKIGTPEEPNFELSGSERKFLSITSSDSDVSKNISDLETLIANTWNDTTVKELNEANKEVINYLKDIDLDKKTDNIFVKINGFFTSVAGNLASKVGPATSQKTGNANKMVAIGKDKMLGGVRMQIRLHGTPTGGIMSAAVEFVEQKATDSFGKEKSIKALTSQQIASVGDAIGMIGESLLNNGKLVSKNDEFIEKAIAQFDKMSAQLEKMDKDARAKAEKGQVNSVKDVQQVIKGSGKILTANQKTDKAIVTYCMTVARAWLSFGKRSLSNLTDKKA